MSALRCGPYGEDDDDDDDDDGAPGRGFASTARFRRRVGVGVVGVGVVASSSSRSAVLLGATTTTTTTTTTMTGTGTRTSSSSRDGVGVDADDLAFRRRRSRMSSSSSSALLRAAALCLSLLSRRRGGGRDGTVVASASAAAVVPLPPSSAFVLPSSTPPSSGRGRGGGDSRGVFPRDALKPPPFVDGLGGWVGERSPARAASVGRPEGAEAAGGRPSSTVDDGGPVGHGSTATTTIDRGDDVLRWRDNPKSKRVRFLNLMGMRRRRVGSKKKISKRGGEESPALTTAVVEGKTEGASESGGRRREPPPPAQVAVTSREELDRYFTDADRRFRKKKSAKKRKASDRDGEEGASEGGAGGSSETTGEGGDDDDDEIDYDALLAALSVCGDTQIIGSRSHPDRVHPVLRVLHDRRRSESKPSSTPRPDGRKVALAVEGGGMRGCVSAGMVAAIHYLGLGDAFDVVYGSSAGTVIGAYFITKQLPWFGPEIYYDSLTTAGKGFIDSKRILRAVGLGLLDPRLLKDVVARSDGKPVLNLPYLLRTVAQERKPLNWTEFERMQSVQPLKVVASGLRSERAVVMDMETGSFDSMDELANCMHASCLLPGIAGPVMNIRSRDEGTSPIRTNGATGADAAESDAKHIIGNDIDSLHVEPLADALIYEPIPYRAAIADGATHVVVLRTRPDGVDVTGKSSLFERLIVRRFFLRKNKLRRVYKRMRMQLHKKLYAEQILELNEAAAAPASTDDDDAAGSSSSGDGPRLMPIALPPNSDEVTRLETDRKAIFEGVRRGFARTYDALVEDPSERGRGSMVSRQYFPDEILEYDPLEIDSREESAFDVYLRRREREGNPCRLPTIAGKTASEAGAPW